MSYDLEKNGWRRFVNETSATIQLPALSAAASILIVGQSL